VPVETQAAVVPNDLFILADSSASMDCLVAVGKGCTGVDGGTPGSDTRWDLLSSVMESMAQMQLARIAMGALFTPRVDAVGKEVCGASDYSMPSVPFSMLPDGFIKARTLQARGGNAPLSAPLEGAFAYIQSYGMQNPGRRVSLAVILDGFDQTACVDDWTQAQKIATIAAASNPPVRTTTISLGLEEGASALHLVARAGGTRAVRALDVSGGGGSAHLANSLAGLLRSAATPCDFDIPASLAGKFDPRGMYIRLYYSNLAEWRLTPAVGAASNCADADGWYFDDTARPTRVSLCPTTCSDLAPHTEARIVFGVPCPDAPPPPRP
jgi:hypothetical protein